VRVTFQKCCLRAALSLLLVVPPAVAQNPVTMDPELSSAKAKQLVEKAIEALGGFAYRNNEESDCDGRVAQFDRGGGMLGFSFIHSYWHYPDKNRIEYEVKTTKAGPFALLIGRLPVKGGSFIQLFSGDKGWTMDKGGVSDADATVVAEFQDTLKRQIHNLLLERVNEQGVYLRWGGLGIADLRQVEWVEITDADGRTVRLALERESHLPMRTVVSTPNEETRDMDEDVTIYSNYKEHDGVQTPMQISREHNGRRTHQIFYFSCSNNPNLPADFFTEQSLRERFAKTGGKPTPQK
jgi:hypothetical protein